MSDRKSALARHGLSVLIGIVAMAVLAACSPPDAKALRTDEAKDRQAAYSRDLAEQATKLAWIDVKNAVADADTALKADDHRLYGIYGFAVSIPGRPGSEGNDPGGCGLKMIDGTSDHGSHELTVKATAYAKAYNERILSRSTCFTDPT